MVGLTNDKFVANTENIQNVATQVDISEVDLDEQKPIGIQATDW